MFTRVCACPYTLGSVNISLMFELYDLPLHSPICPSKQQEGKVEKKRNWNSFLHFFWSSSLGVQSDLLYLHLFSYNEAGQNHWSLAYHISIRFPSFCNVFSLNSRTSLKKLKMSGVGKFKWLLYVYLPNSKHHHPFYVPCWVFRTCYSNFKNDHWLDCLTWLLFFFGIFSLSMSEGERQAFPVRISFLSYDLLWYFSSPLSPQGTLMWVTVYQAELLFSFQCREGRRQSRFSPLTHSPYSLGAKKRLSASHAKVPSEVRILVLSFFLL